MGTSDDFRTDDAAPESFNAAAPEVKSVSFWVTGARPDWLLDREEYYWPLLSFGTMSVRLSRLAGGLLQIELGGAALDDRWLVFVTDCPVPELAPNGRLGVLIDLSWQSRGVRVSVQNELLAEHRFALH